MEKPIIKRVVLEFEERVVIWEGEDAEKMIGLMNKIATELVFEKMKAEPVKTPTSMPIPTHIFDARDKDDYPR